MNFIEALRDPLVISGEYWIRPLSWKDAKAAYCIKQEDCGKYIFAVPDARGGYPTLTRDVELLCDEWEVINPDEVFK
jgi:hypothetical protein